MILRVRSSAGTWRITLADEPAPNLGSLKAAVELAHGLPTSSQQFASDPTGKQLLQSTQGSGGGSDAVGGSRLLSEVGLGHGDLVYLMGKVVKVSADRAMPARYDVQPDSDDDQEPDNSEQGENMPLALPSRDPPQLPIQAADVNAASSGGSDAANVSVPPTCTGSPTPDLISFSSITTPTPAGASTSMMARPDGDVAHASSFTEDIWNDTPRGAAFAQDSGGNVRAPDASQRERMVEAFPALSSELAAAIVAAAAEEEHLRFGSSGSGSIAGGSVADASSGEALLAAELQAAAGDFSENGALRNRDASWVDEMAAQLLARRAAANAESMDARLARLLQQGEADAEDAEAWAADAMRDATQPFENGYGQDNDDYHHLSLLNSRRAASISPSLVQDASSNHLSGQTSLRSPPPRSRPRSRASDFTPSPSTVDDDDDGVLPAMFGSSSSRGHGNDDDRLTEAIRLSLLASSTGSTGPPLEQPPNEQRLAQRHHETRDPSLQPSRPRSANRRQRHDNTDSAYGALSTSSRIPPPVELQEATWAQRQATVRQQADALLQRSPGVDGAAAEGNYSSHVAVGLSQVPPRVPSVRPQFTSDYLSATAAAASSFFTSRGGQEASSVRPLSGNRRPRTPLAATSAATTDADASAAIGVSNNRSSEYAMRSEGNGTATTTTDAGGGWWQEDGTISSSAAWAQAAAASSVSATSRNSATWAMSHRGVHSTGASSTVTLEANQEEEDDRLALALAASMHDHREVATAAQRDQEAFEAALQSSMTSNDSSSLNAHTALSSDGFNNTTTVNNSRRPQPGGFTLEDEEEALQRAIAESLK